MDHPSFKRSALTLQAPHRGAKHLGNKVNGETRKNQSEIITEVQMKKRM